MAKIHDFMVLPRLPENLKELDFIVRNMFWSWNTEYVRFFKRIEGNLWSSCGHNPVKLLNAVSQRRLEELSENQGFLCEYRRLLEKLRSYLSAPTWFEKEYFKSDKALIAYFSAEFGIHESLPLYAGGLGILSGDHLKSASDLGIPLVGIGLLYQKGYFRQYLNIDGWQQEVYVENDFYQMPIEIVRDDKGQPLTISVEFPGRDVYAQIWRINVGRIKLYLLDTNVAANVSEDKMITSSLYGGDRGLRIRQEIMIGIGGMRALRALGINPTVCHMNEGHAAFMGLERIRQLCEENELDFEEAFEATRSGNVFTIHTPVKAGLDEFPVSLMDKYFGDYIGKLGLERGRFLSLGKIGANDSEELFKMPILALKLSSYRNGVSKLHGEVSRKMWSGLWPGVPEDEIPIQFVTNGVHLKTWLSEEMNSLFESYLGTNWSEQMDKKRFEESIKQIPDAELWRTHQRSKERLVVFCRNCLKRQLQRRGSYHTELNWAEEVFDPESLTIGFARRFATYKRGNLLFKDPKRLVKLLKDSERPIQLIFSGKAHPQDTEGKEIIRQIIHFASNFDVRRRLVFLEDYDSNTARVLVRGVDVWLNTPRRPMEASGTSGMKAAINGSLNMSTLDGWWCEGYSPERGWAIGTGRESYKDPAYQDVVESQAIYNVLENEVVPLFYKRSADNLPRAWIYRMKQSIKGIASGFSTHRMLSEYTGKFYNSAISRWNSLSKDNMSGAKGLAAWRRGIEESWGDIVIKDVDIQVRDGSGVIKLESKQPRLQVGLRLDVKALIKLGKINPEDVSVEIYYGAVDVWGNIKDGSIVKMDVEKTSGSKGEYLFIGSLSCKDSGRQGLSVRILPHHPDMLDPYRPGMIIWEGMSSSRVLSTAT